MEQQTVDAFEQTLAFIKAAGRDRAWSSPSSAGRRTCCRSHVFDNRPVFDDPQWDGLATGLNRLGKIAADAACGSATTTTWAPAS